MSFCLSNNTNQIIHGDSLEKLKQLESDSIDSIVTDPPYGYSFMNKDWDKAVVSVDVWRECLRVLKSGAFAFIMSSPRQDVLCKMILNLIDAGFETNFTSIYWTYASGFPKAANVSKLVDKRNGKYGINLIEFVKYVKQMRDKKGVTNKQIDEYLNLNSNGATASHYTCIDGQQPRFPRLELYYKLKEYLKLDDRYDEIIQEAEREIIGQKKWNNSKNHFVPTADHTQRIQLNETKSATEAAKRLDGSYAGFQPKPSLEVILTVMKPLSEKSFVDQALSNQKGITWLDDCRIPYKDEKDVYYGHHNKSGPNTLFNNTGIDNNVYEKGWKRQPNIEHEKGRFPANIICSDDALNDGKIHKTGHLDSVQKFTNPSIKDYERYQKSKIGKRIFHPSDSGSYSRYFDLDAWFLAIPKASASERNKGLENSETKKSVNDGRKINCDVPAQRGQTFKQNFHPTVKPIKLMSYLITMGSRENDIILDPFCGSGTTCIAATILNRKFIGIELNKEYVDIANKRLEPYKKQTKLSSYQKI